VIVGFPGETEDDFAQTLDVVREARFAAAFTFQYSKRPGTPAAEMPDQVPPAVVAERYPRLVDLVGEVAWSENRRYAGQQVEVLVAEGEGRKDGATHRLSGRARDNRLVHLGVVPRPGDVGVVPRPGDVGVVPRPGDVGVVPRPGDVGVVPRPGDVVEAVVTYAAPHHLVADTVLAVRRTRGGDAHDGRVTPAAQPGVLLGMPSVRRD
jgi:tRNA-2-methylthio-N6-dimethylallyladenosine synthase